MSTAHKTAKPAEHPAAPHDDRVKCPACGGSGKLRAGLKACPKCLGLGSVHPSKK